MLKQNKADILRVIELGMAIPTPRVYEATQCKKEWFNNKYESFFFEGSMNHFEKQLRFTFNTTLLYKFINKLELFNWCEEERGINDTMTIFNYTFFIII